MPRDRHGIRRPDKTITEYTAEELNEAIEIAEELCPEFFHILRGVDAYMERRRRRLTERGLLAGQQSLSRIARNMMNQLSERTVRVRLRDGSDVDLARGHVGGRVSARSPNLQQVPVPNIIGIDHAAPIVDDEDGEDR